MHTLRTISELPDVIGPLRWEFLSALGQEARLVGGAVRDALLGIPSNDLDVLVESPLQEFLPVARKRVARALTIAECDIRIVEYQRFLTAKMYFPRPVLDGLEMIDIGQSRTEHYSCSGAEPTVSPGDRLSDTNRRDFSVNAIAIRLGDEPILDDPACGSEDLKNGVLRILHKKSFEDDPARILRGVRFVSRFGFHFEEESGALFHTAIDGKYMKRLPPFRLFDEFKKLLAEPHRDAALLILESYGALEQVLPGVRLSEETVGVVRKSSDWVDTLLALTNELGEEAFSAMLKRFAMSSSVRKLLLGRRRDSAH